MGQIRSQRKDRGHDWNDAWLTALNGALWWPTRYTEVVGDSRRYIDSNLRTKILLHSIFLFIFVFSSISLAISLCVSCYF